MIGASRLRRIQNCGGRLKEIVGDEGVIQLAKDGICPHYVMINPITEEETIWFNPSELNEWFEMNFIKYNVIFPKNLCKIFKDFNQLI